MNGHEGPLCLEVKAALYDKSLSKPIIDYIYGLGGREIRTQDIEDIYKEISDPSKLKSIAEVKYLGVRE